MDYKKIGDLCVWKMLETILNAVPERMRSESHTTLMNEVDLHIFTFEQEFGPDDQVNEVVDQKTNNG